MLKSSFAKNVTKLMSGAILVQICSLIAQPFLTRIFTPDDYGKFATLQALVNLFPIFCALSYERTIVLAKDNEEANALASLSCQLSIITGFIYATLLAIPSLTHLWLGFYLPWSIKFLFIFWLTGVALNSIGTSILTRNQEYRYLTNIRIIIGVSSVVLQLIIGYAGLGAYGLILVNLSLAFVNGSLLIYSSRSVIKAKLFTNLSYYMLKYREFPQYQLVGALLDTASLQLVLILINKFLGVASAGQYALANRVLAIPLSLIGGAFAQVFYQEFTKRYQQQNKPYQFLLNTWLKLFLLGLIPCAVLFTYAEQLFPLIFGSKWQQAGWFAHYLCLMSFIMLINSPTSGALVVIGKHRWFLFITILYFIARIGSLLLIPLLGIKFALISFIIAEVFCIILYNLPLIKYLSVMR
ncbi:MAG: hypothetical protein RLZZ293_1468 [Pseudomonadota bacterium]|jgi:O-antigen/teichoic acid export membrane protein